MPKIEAATVAEHRALREKAVTDAAVGILVTEGAQAVTPGAVAREAGIARTSVYQYFPSTGALLGAALEALGTRRESRLRSALEDSGADPRARIAAYVRTSIELADDAAPPVDDLDSVPGEIRERLRSADARTRRPLREAVEELGSADPALVTALVHGVLHTAGSVVTAGRRVEEVAEAVSAFVMAGVDASAGSRVR